MHVAVVTTSFPDATPGSEAAGGFVADFVARLADHVEVTVVAAASSDDRACEGSVDVRRFAVPRLPLSLLRPLDPRDWSAIIGTIQRGNRAVQELVTERRPDHILALWALPSGYWADGATRRAGIPYSIWALGSDIWGLGSVPVVRGVLRRVLQGASHCFADGLQLAQDVESISGRGCNFMASSRQLQDPGAGRAATSAPYRLAFLGRWHPNKGIDLLLDALESLDDADWQRIESLRICGGGPLQDEVLQRAARLASAGKPVETGGYLDRDAASELISWADYLLLPSRIESIPVIFSDTVQLGTPLIATPVGDLPRLFDQHRVGVLADDASAAGIASALRTALAGNAQDFTGSLASVAAKFDVAQVAREFAATLESGND
jgi:glycosyltransferase involved in cell wall biosynthesis